MAVDLTKLQAEVANATTVGASILAILKAIPPSNDPATQAAIDSLTAALTASDQALADAVTANTPSEPTT